MHRPIVFLRPLGLRLHEEVDLIVTGFQPYGVFATTKTGVSGLVHKKNIANTFVKDVRQHFKLGDNITATVIEYTDEKGYSFSTVGYDLPIYEIPNEDLVYTTSKKEETPHIQIIDSYKNEIMEYIEKATSDLTPQAIQKWSSILKEHSPFVLGRHIERNKKFLADPAYLLGVLVELSLKEEP